MNQSFYTGALGAGSFATKMGIMANNLANVNNNGYKAKTAAFTDLLNYNLNDSEDAVTNLMAGNGVRMQRTYTDFSTDSVTSSNSLLDFAIMQDNAFFMVQDPGTEEITYTRSGHFHRGDMDGTFYLMSDSNKLVLDEDGEPIEVARLEENGQYVDITDKNPGVYTFTNPSRLLSVGNNEFAPAEDAQGMEPILVENPTLTNAALETSGTDVAKEMVRVIETQRAFSYALKMVTTSDEIESTINSLRG